MTARPSFSLRSLPVSIPIALGASCLGVLVVLVALAATSGEGYERLSNIQRWTLFEAGCSAIATLLLGAGLLELARRHTGGTRTLVRVAAGLVLANLVWHVLELAIAPRDYSETTLVFLKWSGRAFGLFHLAMVVLVVTAADGWRRLLLPALGLLLISVTGSWVPVIGKEIQGWLGDHFVLRYAYGFARVALSSTCLLFLAGGIAARAPGPVHADVRRAVDGLVLARAALYARLIAAGLLLLLAIGIRSRSAQQLVFTTAPLVGIVSLAAFAAAILRVAAARVPGMPVLRLAVGAALVVWWAAVQHEQLLEILRSHGRGGDPLLGTFSLVGPVAMTLGMALVGSAIGTYARVAGDAALGSAATALTATFVGLSLGSVAFLALIAKASSLAGAMGMLFFAVLAQISAVLVLGALLGRAAQVIAHGPQLPPARVV